MSITVPGKRKIVLSFDEIGDAVRDYIRGERGFSVEEWILTNMDFKPDVGDLICNVTLEKRPAEQPRSTDEGTVGDADGLGSPANGDPS